MSARTNGQANGTPLVGTVLTLPGVATAELLAEPFDVVWVDLEHGALGLAEAQELIVGAQAAGARALVRLAPASERLLAATLDAGADGVVLAAVDTAETAARAVSMTRHPPAGQRGYGLRRAATRGRHTGGSATAPTVWAQIETVAGVAATAAIAAVDGIDAVVVGTADLSFAVGTPLDSGSPALLEAVAAVRDAVRAAPGAPAFGVAGALDRAPAELLRGAQLLIHGTDARICASAADAAAAHMTELLAREEREATT